MWNFDSARPRWIPDPPDVPVLVGVLEDHYDTHPDCLSCVTLYSVNEQVPVESLDNGALIDNRSVYWTFTGTRFEIDSEPWEEWSARTVEIVLGRYDEEAGTMTVLWIGP